MLKPNPVPVIQSRQFGLFWGFFLFSRFRILVLYWAHPEKELHFFPLGITIRMRLKHAEIQGGCSLNTDTSNASFLAICLCNFFLQNLDFFFYLHSHGLSHVVFGKWWKFPCPTRTLSKSNLFTLEEVQWALQHSFPILQWWLGRDRRLSLHKEPYGDDKGEAAPGEGSFWYKKQIFSVRTPNHWNNLPSNVEVSISGSF